MRRALSIAIAALLTALPTASASAAGTPAGTILVSQATATYRVGPTTFVAQSNVSITAVAELLNVAATWQDAAPVTVAPGDTGQATTFLVTNTGNGSEAFTLAGLSTLGGDDFDPTLADIYFDTDGNGFYDPAGDARYIPGVNDPLLLADSSVVVFLVNSIPSAALEGNQGNTRLTASANTGTGVPGTLFAGLGDGGVDAVTGPSGGTDAGIGTYAVSSVVLTIAKSVAIADPFGGTEPVPGATLTYSLVINVTGSGTAVGVVVTDPIPANATYVPGTLALNAALLTDVADADEGDVGATTPGEITVILGDLAPLSPTQTITFAVIIN